MKKILFFLLLLSPLLSFAQDPTDTVDIPDENFKWALLNQTFFGSEEIDTNNDGEIEYSEAEAVDSIRVGDGNINQHIHDMTGIEAFVNMTYLQCYNNDIDTLDLSQNTLLEKVVCDNNPMTFLALGNNPNLTVLECEDNQLTTLDVSQNTGLQHLDCHQNQIDELNLSNLTSLTFLRCENNQLTSLFIQNGNNTNFTLMRATNNLNLTCVFVDDKSYCENAPHWYIDSASHFVETQEQCDALGIQNFDLEKIKLYPNPVKNKLNLDFPKLNLKNTKGYILDISGKVIMALSLKNSHTILQLSGLASGMYFLQLSNEHQKFTKKIIKL